MDLLRQPFSLDVDIHVEELLLIVFLLSKVLPGLLVFEIAGIEVALVLRISATRVGGGACLIHGVVWDSGYRG